MSDLIERLRDRSGFVERGPMALMQHCEEAANEIERLTAEVERLRAGLQNAQTALEDEHNYDPSSKCYLCRALTQITDTLDAAIKEAGNG